MREVHVRLIRGACSIVIVSVCVVIQKSWAIVRGFAIGIWMNRNGVRETCALPRYDIARGMTNRYGTGVLAFVLHL